MHLINVQQPAHMLSAAKAAHSQKRRFFSISHSRLIVQSPPMGRGRAEGAGEGALVH